MFVLWMIFLNLFGSFLSPLNLTFIKFFSNFNYLLNENSTEKLKVFNLIGVVNLGNLTPSFNLLAFVIVFPVLTPITKMALWKENTTTL